MNTLPRIRTDTRIATSAIAANACVMQTSDGATDRKEADMETDKLDWHPVVSSNLREVAFVPDTGTLYIRFKDNATYAYAGADNGLFLGLLDAASPGSYFAKYVKRLPTRKL
jgi:KTSC domain